MKPKLILHIGSQKTGTTSIQQFLAQNRDYLNEQDIYIPDYLGGINHRYAVFLAEEHNKRDDAFTRSYGLKDNDEKKIKFKHSLLSKLKSDSKRNCNKIWIISSEFFQSRLNTEIEVSRLYDIVNNLFRDIKIICYVRDPLSTAISTWSTYVMSGGVARHLQRPRTIFHNNCDHKNLVTRWEDGFHQHKIIVGNFSSDSLIEGNIIHDFCCKAHIRMDPKFTMPPKNNSSLSYKGILILSEINSRIEKIKLNEKRNLKRIISRIVHKNFREFPYYLPTKKEIYDYDNSYSESFEWVSNKYFKSYTRIADIYAKKFREEDDMNYSDKLNKSENHFVDAIIDLCKLKLEARENNIRNEGQIK